MRNAFHRRFARATEPQILFPLIALCLLIAIWGTTLSVLKVRRADAEHAAAVSSRELLGTYEAQVVRALGEIDGALNLVKFYRDRDVRMSIANSGTAKSSLSDSCPEARPEMR